MKRQQETNRIIKQAHQASPVQGLLIKILWITMVRVSELVALRIADIHFDDEYANVPANKDRLVVITPPLAQELRS